MKMQNKPPLSFPNIAFPTGFVIALIAIGIFKDDMTNPFRLSIMCILCVWIGFGLKQWNDED